MRRIALLLAIALVVTGCGDDSGDEYVASLEEIGAAQTQASSEIIPPGVAIDAPSLEQVRALTELRRGALEDLQTLEPPEELVERHTRMSATLAVVVAALDRLVAEVGETGNTDLLLFPNDVIAAQAAFVEECEAMEMDAGALVGRAVDLSC